MGKNDGKVVIFLYNLFMLLLCTLMICLIGVWALEGNVYSRHIRALTISVYIIFFPEVIFGLKWGLNSTFGGRIFTILCTMADGLILHRLFNYLYVTRSTAPITNIIMHILMALGIIWTIVIEFNENLRDHILFFPQAQWLIPNGEDDTENRYWHGILVVLAVAAFVFVVYARFIM
ncbi:MAG: hypothetical protein HDR04_16605 [Lachnospiraceae bacterium]|nr:hypothetical protein [Lachnospiraceae bacterium]